MGQKAVNTDGSIPLRDRQETYCQLYSTGTYSATEAYRLAGYSHKQADTNSALLNVKQRIKARIAYIQAQRAAKEHVTRDTLASEYNRAYSIAEDQDNAPGMVSATTGKARLYGLDKQVIEQHTDEPMSKSDQEQADEWAEFVLWKSSQSGPRVVDIREGA